MERVDMRDMRDDFSDKVKRLLAHRVNLHCSNPECGAQTAGPQARSEKALNIGVAAHITAAAPGGPRYDASLTQKQRRASTNGIWLCQNCAKLVDNDRVRYTADLLRQWKADAERQALDRIGRGDTSLSQVDVALLEKFSGALRQDVLDFLREHAMGDAFPDRHIDELVRIRREWDNAQHEFRHPALERQRIEFLSCVQAFSRSVGANTWSLGPPNHDHQRVPKEWHWEQPERWKNVVEELDGLATAVFDAREQLIRIGRKLM
jgi:hypothetical protein